MTTDPLIARLLDALDKFSIPQQSALVCAQTVASMLGVSRRTVFRMRQRGELPPPIEVSSNIVRWKLSDIQEHLKSLKTRSPRRP